MNAVVEVDEKGRILLPLELRKKLKSKRFKVKADDHGVKLEPIADFRSLRGKYRDSISSDWEELEEKGEQLVSSGKR
ncbi:MAG: AbrB family transcriptional regulator [Thaumarchaeota archaeon]|nr:AbrB family transcriptional regulator [Nitrososphaerota archaeon]